MGHSDRLVIADGNFPAESMGRDAHVIHMEGHGVPEILEAILLLFPLDTYVKHPVCLMSVMDGDSVETPIWNQYGTLVEAFDSRGRSAIGHMGRLVIFTGRMGWLITEIAWKARKSEYRMSSLIWIDICQNGKD